MGDADEIVDIESFFSVKCRVQTCLLFSNPIYDPSKSV
jgi:hypothetical protein